MPFFSLFINAEIRTGAEIPMGADKFNSLLVEYDISGKYQTGKETFLQKNGKTFRETYIETKILSKTFYEHTLEIDDGVMFYRINLINKTGIRLPSLNTMKRKMIEKNPHLFSPGTPNPLSITPPKGLLNKTEKILDKECKVYLYNNRMFYIWENIILQEIYDIVDKSVKKAKKLEINKTVDDQSFIVPKEVSFPAKEQG